MGKRPSDSLLAYEFAKAGAVETVEGARIVEIVGHRQRRALKVAGVLPHIGFGDRKGRIDDCLGADFEPAVKADIERDRRYDGDQDGGQHRDQREHGDDAHMQARRGFAAPPGHRDAMNFPSDQADKEKDEGRVDGDQNKRRGFVRL